jgi:hypothetical protein
VDGAFIKSFYISGERSVDVLDYLDPDKPSGILPLNYLGTVQNIPTRADELADFWICAPGANIVHFRKASEENTWDSYAGGDPRHQSKRSKAGRVVVALTSAEPYWILTALSSVKHHFAKADKFVINLELPSNAKHFREIDQSDPFQASDMRFFREMEANRARGEKLHNRITVSLGADTRFLAKLALAIGYKLFGTRFLDAADGLNLRKAFREADGERRRQIPIRGSGYYSGVDLAGLNDTLRWPGGWVLLLIRHAHALVLSVQSPSGRPLVIQVTDDPALLEELDAEYRDGVIWVTVPSTARAVGPMSFPEFLAHQIGQSAHPGLRELEALRGQRGRLPPTGISAQEEPEQEPNSF